MKKIEYIDLMSEYGDCFRIYEDNIGFFSCEQHQIKLDNTDIIDNVIKNMQLKIINKEIMINLDGYDNFDVDLLNISAIRVFFDDESDIILYVAMTDDDFNKGQMNRLDGNELYITIKDDNEDLIIK